VWIEESEEARSRGREATMLQMQRKET